MSKGEETRKQILDFAMDRASEVGLEGLSIGMLAAGLGMSKSGLYAHFKSKETLQVETVEAASAKFADNVVKPALQRPRGLPRVRALFERWLSWATHGGLSGGCLFVAASIEFDDRPGDVRAALTHSQREWVSTIARAAEIAVEEGHFKAELDPSLFAFAAYSIMLGAHLYVRLLDDPNAVQHARSAFDALIETSSKP